MLGKVIEIIGVAAIQILVTFIETKESNKQEDAHMVKINVLKKGDEVLNVTTDFVAVKRKNGEVDIIRFFKDVDNWRVDLDNIVTIGYGKNTIQVTLPDSDTTITTFQVGDKLWKEKKIMQQQQ